MAAYKHSDKIFNYHGRWESTNDYCISHWVRPYVEFTANRNFSVLTEENSGSFSVSINGEQVSADNGTYHVLNGTALVRITSENTAKPVLFKGIETDGMMGFVPSREKHILFIGDSLTHSSVSHSAVLPKRFNYDYTCIAQGSMSLCLGRGYLKRPDRVGFEGMSSAFFCLQSPVEPGELTPYDFGSGENFDAVFIHIGTNDHLTDETYAEGFCPIYLEFVGKVRSLYPDAPIYLLLPIADSEGGWRRNTIEKCALECEKLYNNITYISSRKWNVEISEDKIHPTNAGYAAFAEQLMCDLPDKFTK